MKRRLSARSQKEFNRIKEYVGGYTQQDLRTIEWGNSFNCDIEWCFPVHKLSLMVTPLGLDGQLENQLEYAYGQYGAITYIRLLNNKIKLVRTYLEFEEV